MAQAQAAYIKKIRVSADGTTWHELAADSPSLDAPVDVLETTNLRDNQGFKSRILGLQDWSISCDSFYTTDDPALKVISSGKLNRTNIFVQYLPNGLNGEGFQGTAVVESFNLSGGVGDVEKVGISLQANGPLQIIPSKSK